MNKLFLLLLIMLFLPFFNTKADCNQNQRLEVQVHRLLETFSNQFHINLDESLFSDFLHDSDFEIVIDEYSEDLLSLFNEYVEKFVNDESDAYLFANRIWLIYNNHEDKIRTNSFSYYIAIMTKATLEYSVGNYPEAKQLFERISDYGGFYSLIADLYTLDCITSDTVLFSTQNLNESIEKIFSKVNQFNLNKTFFNVLVLNQISEIYSNINDVQSSLQYALAAKSIAIENHFDNSLLYFEVLYSLTRANCLLMFDNEVELDDAVNAYNEMVEFSNEFGLNTPTTRLQIYQWKVIIDLFDSDDIYNSSNRQVWDIYKLLTACYDNLKPFDLLTEKQRKNTWQQNLQFVYESILPTAIWLTEDNDTLNYIAYESILQTKGILLQSSLEFSKIIEKSNDKRIQQLYSNYIENKTVLDKGSNLNVLEYQKLLNKNYLIEQELLNYARESSNMMSFLDVNYDSIQAHLSPYDMAIELFKEPINDTYYALIALKDYVPILCDIGSEAYLDSLKSDPEKLAGHFWSRIFNYITANANVHNIYVSPCGMFYNVPIEYLGLKRFECAFDSQYRIYRVSSTREIVQRPIHKGEGAIIYGGVKYDINIKSNRIEKPVAKKKRSLDGTGDGLQNDPNFLYWSDIEAKNIHKILRKGSSDLKSVIKRGKDATELSFMQLSGANKRVIHVATHGFYYQGIEDPMERTGLLFAGASNSDDLPSNNDGYLFASDISQLDLRGLDLVVLSACETGLGDIDYEGVFGLQRAFKKAGANSIIMSLSNVDDEATNLFMTSFFEDWAKTDDKYASFMNAQNKVKIKYPDVKIWGAFVLLDGLR